MRKGAAGMWMSMLSISMCVMFALLLVPAHPVAAQGGGGEGIPGVSITVNMTSISLNEADYFTFTTHISNNGTTATPALVAHLNVVALQTGIYVDPEDWCRERTVFVGPIAPGASRNLSWKVHALFAGEFAVYVAVLAQDSSSTPVVADEVHIHIEKWSVMQVSNVAPVAVAVPVVLGALYAAQRGRLVLRRREADRARPSPKNGD